MYLLGAFVTKLKKINSQRPKTQFKMFRSKWRHYGYLQIMTGKDTKYWIFMSYDTCHLCHSKGSYVLQKMNYQFKNVSFPTELFIKDCINYFQLNISLICTCSVFVRIYMFTNTALRPKYLLKANTCIYICGELCSHASCAMSYNKNHTQIYNRSPQLNCME